MRSQIMSIMTLLLVLLGPALAAPVLAQDAGRGTTLVCVNEGGDGPYVDEWTPEKVTEYEARTGRDVREITVHPVTGDCTDVAGLILGWFPGTEWLCAQQPDGSWAGPAWAWPMYRPSSAVPPDPATGRCPQPVSPYGRWPTELERAAATAVHLTELEVAGDYDRLYAWMHPDARAVVPQRAMERWYREVFALRPPTWMTVDTVRLVEWTWEVTGTVYPTAAEVAFRQRFADGEETAGVVRLVRDHGVWWWFFGRDRAFIEEQMARSETIPSAPSTPTTAYDIVDLGTGTGNWSTARKINWRGQVLWTWGTTEQDPLATYPGAWINLRDRHEGLWEDGTITDLTDVGLDAAVAINDGGMVLGSATGRFVLYDLDAGSSTPLGAFDDGRAVDVNNTGAVAGQLGGLPVVVSADTIETMQPPSGYESLEPVALNTPGHLVATAHADLSDITAVNQRAVLVRYRRDIVLEAAPGATSSRAADLNNVGQVVGSPGKHRHLERTHEEGRAFLYDFSMRTMTDLGTLPGYRNSVGTAINNHGQVVGFAWGAENEGDPRWRAFLYDHRTGMISDLNELIPEGSGRELVAAFDINDAGQIVGQALIDGQMHAFALTPVD